MPIGASPRILRVRSSGWNQPRLSIPYPWVQDEAHAIALVSSTGAPSRPKSRSRSSRLRPIASSVVRFGLVGLYVGVIPIALGLLWYPVLRRLGRAGMAFVLALTVGLLAFLVADMWGEAQEVALDVPAPSPAPVLIPVLALADRAVAGYGRQRLA